MNFDGQNLDAAYRKGYLIGYRDGYMDRESGKTDISSLPDSDGYCPIEAMGLSARAYNCLRLAGCRYAADVASLETEKIKQIRNLGKVTAAEIARSLEKHGIRGSAWEFFLL